MKGPDHQLDYDARTERLLQRLQRPGGVIDLRWPQEMVARTAGWIGRRFPILDRWNARYASPAFEAVWAIAELRSSATSMGSSLQPVPGDSTSIATEAKPDLEPQQFRVRRQTASLQPSELSPNLEQQDAVRSGPVPSGIESPRQATTGNAVQRKTNTAIIQDTRTAAVIAASTSQNDPSHVQWSVLPLQLSFSGKSKEFDASDTMSSLVWWPTMQREANPATEGNSATDSVAASSWLAYPSRQAARKTRNRPQPLASQSPDEMTPHRRQELPGRAAGPVMQETGNHSQTILSQQSATIQRKAGPSSRVRETPRQGPSPAVGPMIWRRAGTAQASVPASRPPLSGPPAIQRFADSPGNAMSSSSVSNSDTPLATARTKSGINIAQVAEDVGRLLARQLVIERERRGRGL